MTGRVIFDDSYKSLITNLKSLSKGPSTATWESLPLHEGSNGEVIIKCIQNEITKVDLNYVKPPAWSVLQKQLRDAAPVDVIGPVAAGSFLADIISGDDVAEIRERRRQ